MITLDERKYLMDSMKKLLTEYDYAYTEEALNKIINEWGAQKSPLIEAFKKHPNYIPGKFMITFSNSYERGIKKEPSKAFSSWLRVYAIGEMADNLPSDIVAKKEDPDLYLPWDIWHFLVTDFEKYAERTISDETAAKINEMIPNIHAHSGQKTSRVINKICVYLGYDKVNGYNREFAKYADSLSPLTITRNAVLSINPLDYLTMSFGNSWASCHTIDKENRRGMPNDYEGAYSSGTMSYMLDPSSMVFYTVDNHYKGDEYWAEPKINRQMFHWGNDKLVQGRLYPQDNDYDSDAYAPNRNLVQNIMSTIFGFPNLWTLKKGTDNASRYINSRGTHYRDYIHYSNCNLSIVSGSNNSEYITVGADPICIQCGERHRNPGNIDHCGKIVICPVCGSEIRVNEDSHREIDGVIYCGNCFFWCDICEEYHARNGTYVDGYDITVCDHCLEECFIRCDECGELMRDYDTVYLPDENRHVCYNCLDTERYRRCDRCGGWHKVETMTEHRHWLYCAECINRVR